MPHMVIDTQARPECIASNLTMGYDLPMLKFIECHRLEKSEHSALLLWRWYKNMCLILSFIPMLDQNAFHLSNPVKFSGLSKYQS